MCTVLLPPGGNPIAVKKYIIYQICQRIKKIRMIFFPTLWRCSPTRAMTSSFLRFLDHTQRLNIVGMTVVSRRYLYQTTYNKTNIYNPPGGIRTRNPQLPSCRRHNAHWGGCKILLECSFSGLLCNQRTDG
jgi:hypothetical protein